MKLLVTGGAGFIGSNFILYWMQQHPEDEIVNFDSLTYAGNLANLRALESNPRYHFIKGDITDGKAASAALDGVDTIVHYAAESHVDRSILHPEAFVQTNVVGTYTLLEQALKHNVKRFHHISTDEVFGSLELDSNKKFDENTPYQPHSPYSASKAASDHLVRAYHTTYGLPITISNCSNNYGPLQFPEKLIALMIINALQDKALPVYGDGLNVRDWIHVVDHARAVEAILQRGKIGETYCAGGDAERSNIDVVKTILKLVGKPESLISFVKDRPGHDRKYAIDSSKIAKELDFKLQYDFETGLQQTVDWYKDNTDWWKKVLSKEYVDYYKKQYHGK